MGSALDIDVGGRRESFDPAVTTAVRFGRARDLELVLTAEDGEQDRYMSRHVGSFRFRDRTWTLENPAPDAPGKKRSGLDVVTLTGTVISVPPGASAPLPAVGEVRWDTTAERRYAVRFRFDGVSPTGVRASDPASGPATSQVSLTPREVDFCVSLVEPELFGSLRGRRPALPEVATDWHVSLGTVEKTLRGLRHKLATAGMVDFDHDQKIRDKTARLAAAVVELGFVGMSDWRYADAGNRGLQSSADGPRFAGSSAGSSGGSSAGSSGESSAGA